MKKSYIPWLVLAGLAAYVFIGWLALSSGSLGVQAQNGAVWNAITTGGEKLGRLEAQYNAGGIQLPKDLMKDLVEGRKALAAAKQSNDLDAAAAAVDKIQINLTALSEASGILDTTPALISLMDETSEAFNKVGYERGKLIDVQKGYAMTRVIFFPISGLFPDYGILGSSANPAQPMPTSQFAPKD